MKIILTILFISTFIIKSFCQDSPDPVGYEKMSKCSICLLGQKYDDTDVESFLITYGYWPSSFFESEEYNSINIALSYIDMGITLNDDKLVNMIKFDLDSEYRESAIEEISEILDYWEVSADYDQAEEYLCEYQEGKVDEMDDGGTKIYTDSDFHSYKLEMIWYDDLLYSISVSLNDRLDEISRDYYLLGQCVEINSWGDQFVENEEDDYWPEDDESEYNTETDEFDNPSPEVETESPYDQLTYESTYNNDEEQQDYSEQNEPETGKSAMDWYMLAKNESPEKIIEYNTKAIALDPEFSDAYCDRGTAYFNLSKLEEAVSDFSSAIEFDRQSATAYFNRAAALVYLGKNLEAVDDFEKYLEIKGNTDGNEAEVRGWIEDLKLEAMEADKIVQNQKDWLMLGYCTRHLFVWIPEVGSSTSLSELKSLDFEKFDERLDFIGGLLANQNVTGETMDEYGEIKRITAEIITVLKGTVDEDARFTIVMSMFELSSNIALMRSSLKSFVSNLSIDWESEFKYQKLHKAGDVLSDLQSLLIDGEDLNDVRKCNKPCMKEKLMDAVKECRDELVEERLSMFLQKAYMNFHDGKPDQSVSSYITDNINNLIQGKEVYIGF